MLGVMGGGQLARMFVHAAQALGYRTAVLDPDPASPAGRVSHLHVRSRLRRRGRPGAAGAALRGHHHRVRERAGAGAGLAGAQRPVAPRAEAVAICQQRAAEKAHFARCGVPCAPYAVIDERRPTCGRWTTALFPGILKTTQLGYDGKGQCAWPRAPTWPRPGTRCSACPACWKSACRCTARSASSSRAAPTASGCTCRCSRTCTATASWP